MMIAAQKTSQVLLHMSVAFSITYVFTGSLVTGGFAALVEPVVNVALMPMHDRLWERFRARAKPARAMPATVG